MNIAIVCYPTFGGSGVVATELGLALGKRGHNIHFITYNLPVKKNMIITTGTCTIPIKFQKEDKLDAYFGEIGNVKANIN